MKQRIPSMVVVLLTLFLSAYAEGQLEQMTPKTQIEAKRPPDNGWAISLLSAEMPRSVPCYIPTDLKGSATSGSIIKAPPSFLGGMSQAIIVPAKPEDKDNKTLCGFIAGEINPNTNGVSIVLATFEIMNVSKITNSFKVGDIHFRASTGEPTTFRAVGEADSPLFAKFTEIETKAASEVTITLCPEQKARLTFVFGSAPTGLPISYSFLGSTWRRVEETGRK